VPIVDDVVAARLSLATATRDGFEKERLGGTDPNDEKLLAGRGQLRWLLGENVELMLGADVSREKQVQSQGKCSVVNGGRNALAALNMLVGYTQACADVAASDNPRRVETDISGLRDEIHTYGGSARLMWEIFPDTTLRSITALRGLENEQVFDFDGTRVTLIRPDNDNFEFQQQQISQELQLASRMLDGRLDYIVGVYALKESSKDEIAEGLLSDLQVDDIAVPAELLPLPADQIVMLARGAQIQFTNRVDNLSYSAFAQGTYAITDELSLTAGLRASYERRRLFRRGVSQTAGNDFSGLRVDPGVITNFFEQSERFNDLTPSASLSYKFDEGLLAYASFSKGFKSGGFNGRSFRPIGVSEAALPFEFDPEELTTYEVGFKGSFLDQRLVVNAAAFRSIYEDVQLTVLSEDPDVAVQNVNVNLLNAGKSLITGGELELVMNPFPNLQLRSSLGILHDRFKEFDDPSDARAQDRHLAFVSPYTSSTSVEYSFDLFSMGNLTARADWSTRSQQFFDSPNSEGLKGGKRGLLDARLSLQLADGVTEFALFGKNLTDREYLVSGVDFSASFGNQIRFVGPPRTYGIELRRRF
jgi:iron complex outermembrane receptor protein